jgi:hypothetical protein
LALVQFIWEGWAKLRRFLIVRLRKEHVRRMQELRRGECLRCGACCTVMIRCPHLEGDNKCTIYETRPTQCRMFPIDVRDLRGRFSACGFYFVTEAEAAEEELSGETI